MKRLVLIVLAFTFLGCGIKEMKLTSVPSEATVTLYDSYDSRTVFLGRTPALSYMTERLKYDAWLDAEVFGYETTRWLIPKQAPFDHHFDLEKSTKFKPHDEPYPKEYSKAVLDFLGKCDRVIRIPRFKIPEALSEAKTDLQKIQIEFPQYKLLNRELARLLKLNHILYYEGQYKVLDEIREFDREIKKEIGIF
jgi:hypothetical protein